ncbi:LapA family protein [Mycobacterium heidelbergense]|uniref:LapA family protein n=1 Tax=Mycobacterium heidelbergense TaxID=53376 RepID=UPI003CF82768
MRHVSRDLFGHGRTTGRVAVAAAVLALVVCVANFALGHVNAGIDAAIVGLLALGAGLDWLAMDRRRIRQAERESLVGR